MSDARNVELTPANRIAQASMVLVEQVGMSLLSDAYKFPESSKGHIKTVNDAGLLKFDGPVDEYVKTSMMYKQDEKTKQIGTWNHTECLDADGKTQATVDKVNMGYLLDVLISGKLGSHTDFKGVDGGVQIKMDGLEQLTPHDTSPQPTPPPGGWSLPMTGNIYIADSTNKISAPDGTYIADVQLTAKPGTDRNTIDIVAVYTRKVDPPPVVVPGTPPPQPIALGSVEIIVTVDPNTHKNADFQLLVKGPPPQAVFIPGRGGRR
jgi:hypothetical protein